MRKIYFILAFVGISALLGGVLYFRVHAQSVQAPSGLQLSPMRFDWDMNAGDQRVGVVNVKNYDAVPRTVQLQVEDFYVSDDTTEAKFFVPDASHPLYAYDVINWIEMPQTIELAPGEGRDVTFTVRVPKETPTGGYYGALFFQATFDGGENASTTRVVVNQRIGALLVMAIKGDQPIIRKGEITAFKSARKVFWSKSVHLAADMFNSGNLHYKVLGAMDIYKFGMKMDSIAFEPRIVYPGKTRTFETDWNFSPWAYGYYTAKINLVSDDGKITAQKETSFWIIPWKTTVSITILFVIIWLIFKFFTMKFEIKRKDVLS